MLKYFKHSASIIFLVCLIVVSSACSDNVNRPPTYKSYDGFREVQNSYNSVLKLWPVPYESWYIKTSYGQTHVITWGKRNSPPLILFHGGGNCALMWIYIAERLADKFYVIAPDTPGDVGLSLPVKPFANTTDYAEWFSELLDGIGLSRVNVAGISWGGGVALQVALKYPDKINRMVLMCPAWGIKMFRIWSLVFHSLPAVVFPGPGRVRNLLEWLSVKRPVFADKEGDALVNYLTIALRHYKSPKPVNPVVFTDEELKRIKAPILLLIGDNEVIYSDPREVVHRAKNNLPDVTVTIISRAGHALPYDRPDVVGKKISEFLR